MTSLKARDLPLGKVKELIPIIEVSCISVMKN